MTCSSSATLSAERMRLIRRVSLRQLVYFHQLTRDRNFRLAAANLGVSQPTLSQQLAKLEQDLGISLIERATTGFVLTPEGHSLAADMLPALDQLGAALERHRPATADAALRIGIPSYQSYPQIDRLWADLASRFPSIRLQLVEAPAREMCVMLRDGALDAGIMSIPTPDELPRNVDHVVLWQAPYQLCFGANSPLANKPVLSPDDIRTLEFILLPQNHHPAQFHFQVAGLEALGLTPQLSPSQVTNVSAQMSLAGTTNGVCLVCPETISVPAGLVTRPTAPPLPNQVLALFWPRQNVNPRLERLVLVARDCQAREAIGNGYHCQEVAM